MRRVRGQSLFEVVVATGLVSVALVAMVTATVLGFKTARVSKEREGARKLVDEKVEMVRSARDVDPELFFSQGSYTEAVEYLGTAPVYERQTSYVEVVPGEEYEIVVVVSWADGSNVYTSDQTIVLSNWQ